MSANTSAVLYKWRGRNQRGERVEGELAAASQTLCRAELRRQGIMAQKIRKKRTQTWSLRSKITSGDMTAFSRQMATMMTAGLPLIQAFDIVARGLEKPKLAAMIRKMKVDVESGTTFAEATRKYPKQFNDLFCNLIAAGEQSGSLDIMLNNIAQYKEKTESLKGKIKKALFYPITVVIIAILVTAAMLIFVVPQFDSLFRGFGAELPALTQLIIHLSRGLQAYWWLGVLFITSSLWAFAYARKRSKNFAFNVDAFVIKLPILGKIIRKATIARFARTLSITFAAGLPLVDALKSVAGATGNRVYEGATLKIRDNVATGQPLHSAMRATDVFPNFVVQMVSIGEESGSLESTLSKVADIFEEEVDQTVDGLSSLLEPIIMAFLGIIVGGLVIAMYLPIFQIGSIM